MAKTYIFLIFLTCQLVDASCQTVEKGIIDLSDVDLENRAIRLSGEWEFYWQTLGDPSIIDRLEKDYYTLPSVWNGGATHNGVALSPTGYATYRVRIILPKKRPELSFATQKMFSASVAYMNGFEFVKNGKVGTVSYEAEPDYLPKTTNFRPYSDTIEFVLQVSNYHHHSGGVVEPILLGDRKLLTSKRDLDFSYDFLLSGSLLMGGLFFLGLFLFGQHDRSVLYFALFCISFSYHQIGSGSYALHSLFPDMSWFVLLRAEYLSMFIPAGIFFIYCYLLYPQDAHKNLLYGLAAICGMFSVAALITPTSFFTQLIWPFVILILLAITYLSYLHWVAYRRNRLGSQYALVSTGIIFVGIIYKIAVDVFGFEEITLLSFGAFVCFFFFQSLVLSYRFASSLKEARDAAVIASKAKTEFLSTISHEIKTPLNAVVGISHILMSENPRLEQVEKLKSLHFSADQLTLLINDILDFSKLESGVVKLKLAEVDLRELCDKMVGSVTPMANKKELALSLEFDPSLHTTVLADASRLCQVLNNLLNNAVKFTKTGTVTLKLTRVSDKREFQTVRFQVIDTGIGIADEKKKIIFDSFTQAGSSATREYGGTGLGLAIIKRILEMHQSDIKLESSIGQGSTFSFDLALEKVYKPAQQTLQATAPIQEEGLSGKKILLVEDNQMNIMVAERFLKKWGLDIDIVTNGEEAVNSAKTTSYDLILMDLQMPVMDGYEATEKIRSFDSALPIIALTASALTRVQEAIKASGMNDFLTKPFDPKELKAILEKYIA